MYFRLEQNMPERTVKEKSSEPTQNEDEMITGNGNGG